MDEVEESKNLADVINDLLDEGELNPDQMLPIVGAVIRDKFAYSYSSYTIPRVLTEFDKLCAETLKWTAMDIVIVYYDPSGKVLIINPKNGEHWERARELALDQLMVVYAKYIKEERNDAAKIEKEAINAIEEMVAGKDVFINKEFVDSTKMPAAPQKKAAPAPQVVVPAGPVAAGTPAPKPVVISAGGKKNFTPKYGVQVSNELFHNGNVEAWKKIVESFNAKFPDLEIRIYFKDELINDINSLFKWGKVKHGDQIMFQVAGENIRGVSKLQKYLFEGASRRYEQFLKIGVGKVLNLF